jgi:hypothetical protein
MAVRNVKRWQWILASLAVGLLLGYFQQLPTENWQKAFGDTITQHQFEEGLIRKHSGSRWFRNIVIYPQRLDVAGTSVPVTIVTGEYFNGSLEMQNGQRVAIWHPRCFIAEEPFRPITPNAGAQDGNTVIAYLNSLPGVTYTYAWWRDPTWAVGLWTAGSVLVIGLIWPTIINLLVFGSIMRPKENRGIDLSKVSAQTPKSASKSPEPDLTAVTKAAEELEAKLAAEARPQIRDAQAPAAASPVPQLSGAAVESPMTSEQHEQKNYGQEKDDFYPTEVHRSHSEAKDE